MFESCTDLNDVKPRELFTKLGVVSRLIWVRGISHWIRGIHSEGMVAHSEAFGA